jgi:rhodanese-related sulfurtransferase
MVEDYWVIVMADMRAKIMGTDELKELMNDDEQYVLVDARDAEDYDRMHIPGAVSMSVADVDKLSDGLDKEKEVVIYCSGMMCTTSTEMTALLLKKGFKKVSEYKGGIQDWVSGGNPTE